MRYFLPAVLLIGALACPAIAQEKKAEEKKATAKAAKKKDEKKPVPKHKTAFLTAEKAGPDFQIQGEYVGKAHGGEMKIGLQVIARGDGKFEGVAYPGGLPGAGWEGEQKIPVKGETIDGVTTLTSAMGTAEIKDGSMAIAYDNDNNKVAELRKVTRKSPTLGKKPPKGAMVLFDGKSAKNFEKGKLIKGGMLKEGMWTKAKFGSFKLHMEFMLSFMPYAKGQQRSNSGCYMQGRYETQILDSFGLTGENNECGGIYEIAKPKVNMCLPPLSWQTYDVEFHAAQFDASGKKTKNARMTVMHNGVKIHDNQDLPRSTRASRLKEGPEDGPLYIQNHGNPLRFRNIWVEKIEDKPEKFDKK